MEYALFNNAQLKYDVINQKQIFHNALLMQQPLQFRQKILQSFQIVIRSVVLCHLKKNTYQCNVRVTLSYLKLFMVR